MRFVSLDEARAETWDVALAGTGFAAMYFAQGLRGRGLRVLFIEKGGVVPHDEQLANRNENPYEAIPQDNRSGRRKDWTVLHQFGGCSNCWWGNTPRLHPTDFELKSRYGVGVDWPLSYDDLEDDYAAVEAAMEIAGGEDGAVFPRAQELPYPAHTAMRADRRLREASPLWIPMPTARGNGGARHCCATGACNLCPVDAKYTILNGLDGLTEDGFACVLDTEVRAVVTSGGRAAALAVRGPGGVEAEIRGGLIGLAANAISNAAILLRSGIREDLAGQGLHEQASQRVWMNIPFDNYYGGTSITGLGYGLYDGEFRREAGSVLIETWNAPPSLRLERDKWLQRLKLNLIVEDLPRPENRVILEGSEGGGEAKVVWEGHSDYAYAGLARAVEKVSDIIPFEHEITRVADYAPTESHIQGGTPMGADPETSVVDAGCAVHGVAGLYCLGSGVFPTCSAANPTLTLAAIARRAGRRL